MDLAAVGRICLGEKYFCRCYICDREKQGGRGWPELLSLQIGGRIPLAGKRREPAAFWRVRAAGGLLKTGFRVEGVFRGVGGGSKVGGVI